MAKRDLAEAVHGAAQTERKPKEWTPRGETKSLILRLPVELHRELRQLALDTDTTLQALGVEALQRVLDERRS